VSVKTVSRSVETAYLLPILGKCGIGCQQKKECDKSHVVVIERCVFKYLGLNLLWRDSVCVILPRHNDTMIRATF